jgi:hypothetical protein
MREAPKPSDDVAQRTIDIEFLAQPVRGQATLLITSEA